MDLDLNFLGGSAYDDDIGVWNGTGVCITHHGESDCYADLYNLCARNITGGELAAYWPFTECIFMNQANLCLDTWDTANEECGASDYDPISFDAVIANCSNVAGMAPDVATAVVNCAVNGDHTGMAADGSKLLVRNFEASASSDPEGKPSWITVAGELVDENDYETVDAWGDAVLAAVCSAYEGNDVPAACGTF